jgi:hypothetical protein
VVRLTAPVNPPDGVIVIVELPVAPVLKSAGDEAAIEKSAPTVKVNTAGVECDAVPGEPAPAIVTENVPVVGEEQDNKDVPVPLAASDTGVTVNALQVKPEGRGVSERATEPTKFWRLVNVIVDEIDEPAPPLGELAEIEKSPT